MKAGFEVWLLEQAGDGEVEGQFGGFTIINRMGCKVLFRLLNVSACIFISKILHTIVTGSFEYLGICFLKEEVFLVDVVNKAEALEALAGLKKIS